MGERLAKLLLLTTTTMLGGCSLIYSPGRLPDLLDAPPDTPPPIKSCELALESVSPTELIEGQGDGGGRPAVLVVKGSNIAPDAKITITRHESETLMPSLEIDPAQNVVDKFGVRVAVPVKVNVDAGIGPTTLRLTVTVTQQCPDTGMPVSASLKELEGGAPALTLRGLDELTGTANLPTADPHLFSSVNVTSISAMDLMKPLIVRSTSSITITGPGPYSFSATNTVQGPGGFLGGEGGQALVVPQDGKAGGGPGGGQRNGGGAGFAMTGGMGEGTNSPGPKAGDESLTTLESPNRGSGGAGGQGSNLLGVGGKGGHGGGSVELTAGGNMMIQGAIQANGSNGTQSGGKAGGGGSGGVVLLRAGGTLAAGGVTALGGMPGGGTGGVGSVGRVRVDSPSRAITLTSTPPVGYRGPMFVTTTPLIVREAQPQISLVGNPGSVIKYTLENGKGMTIGPISFTVPDPGEVVLPSMSLFEGYNKLCALVTGVEIRRPEAENCITLAYLLADN